jgi:hypothetical protein
MVAENLQRMEKQDEAFRPTFETALKNSAATAIVGQWYYRNGRMLLAHNIHTMQLHMRRSVNDRIIMSIAY